jgi:hypothetical protein
MQMQINRNCKQLSCQMSKKDHIGVKLSRKLMHLLNRHWTSTGDVSQKWWGTYQWGTQHHIASAGLSEPRPTCQFQHLQRQPWHPEHRRSGELLPFIAIFRTSNFFIFLHLDSSASDLCASRRLCWQPL